jgi:outer membrane protein assembly factor BamB
MSQRWRRLAFASVGLVVLTSCSAGGGGDDASSSTTSTSPKATKTDRGWTRSDLRPITQPLVVGTRLVLFAAGEDDPRLIGLDPATGSTVWQLDASASEVTPGVAPTVAAVGNTVVYLRDRGDDQVAELVGVDVRSGKTSWVGDAAQYTDWPAPCFDDPSLICTTGYRGGAAVESLRFDAGSGELTSSRAIPGGGGRALASGLYDQGTRDPERMTATDGVRELWTKDLAEIFPGDGRSTDTGWNFDRIPKVGLFIGSLGPVTEELGGERSRSDLTTMEVAGIRIADGSVAWRDPGTTYGCNLMPCPGAPASSPTEGAVPTHGVRLRITGTLTHTSFEDYEGTWSDDGKVTIEGFDQRTGRTTWTFDAGHSQNLLHGSSFPRSDESAVVVADAKGTLVTLDLATGKHDPVADDLVAWCSEPTTYEVSPPYDSTRNITSYVGEGSRFACDPGGSRTDAPATIPSWVGATAGGHITWSDTNAVVSVAVGG